MSSIMMPAAGPQMRPRGAWRRRLASLALLGLVVAAAPAQCQDGAEWDRARAQLMAGQPTEMAGVVARWRQLDGSDSQGFDAYAGFLLAWPGLPDETRLRMAAEKSLALVNVDAGRLVAFFDRYPPLTNPARAQYALALAALGRPEAATIARAAWRGGSMSDIAEAMIQTRWGSSLMQADQDARLEALLWDGNVAQASRALARASLAVRPVAQARLALQQGVTADAPLPPPPPADAPGADTSGGDALPPPPSPPPPPLLAPPALLPPASPDMLADPGYLVDRARFLLRRGMGLQAAQMLAGRPPLARPAFDPRRWVGVSLAAARAAATALDAGDAALVATGAVEGFVPGTDIARQSFAIRDDYTSLMWLGGTSALWQLHDSARAALLFARYATAARTPQTRAKGFYWAGRALAAQRDTPGARGYFGSAAVYADQYYGQLALERLGLPMPPMADTAHPLPTDSQRAAFQARPITRAVREVARDADWQTTIKFFREIANQAQDESDFVLLGDYARTLGRRDLAVVAGQAAENAGYQNFRSLCFPLMPLPATADFTMVHAITRQESQFSQNALSRTGARGLMQLMPSTAEGVARHLGLAYSAGALTQDASFNTALGGAYFAHLLEVFSGSYPLAIAAYNAGPGAVRRWLGQYGDPRSTGADWVEWIEKLPYGETRGYVQHVIENAVVYEAMNPARASYRGPNPTSHFLGKGGPG